MTQIILREHQKPNVGKLIEIIKRSYVALDKSRAGSGKTYMSSYLIQNISWKHSIIICPVSLSISTWAKIKSEYDLNIDFIISYEKLKSNYKNLLIRDGDNYYPTEELDNIIKEGCL